MCSPDYFRVDYAINPWMKIGSVNKKEATTQWLNLKNILQSMNINVKVIKQERNLPDMVFSADQGLLRNNNFIVSNFHYKERQEEVKHYLPFLEKLDLTLNCLPKNYYFEGNGECVWYGEKLFVGTGFRNSNNVCKFISKFLDVEVICLELTDPRFYHLDTCLFALNGETAFYVPQAFSSKSRKILSRQISNLIKIKNSESLNFAANSLVTDHHVITQSGNNNFSNQLRLMGYKVIETNMSEFMKAGGGIHCLIQPIKEIYAN